MGLVLGLGVCLVMVTIYSMCMVAGQYDEAMEQDYIKAKKDRDAGASEASEHRLALINRGI